RNGLRPLRYTITDDGMLIVGSETGMVRLKESHIITKGRCGPGEMIAVDLVEGRFYDNASLKKMLAERNDYSAWVKNITYLEEEIAAAAAATKPAPAMD